MKYMIVGNDGNNRSDYPYELLVEVPFLWIFKSYKSLTVHTTLRGAELAMHDHIKFNQEHPAPGAVVKVYTEEDLVIDKLKGTVA